MCQLGKIIVDNRDNVKPFYDDVSMGGGFIDFQCSKCGSSVRKETFYFLTDGERPSAEEVEELKVFFNVIKEPYYNHRSDVGFMKCASCEDEYAVYISGGEVQMGRYQTALIAVAECKV